MDRRVARFVGLSAAALMAASPALAVPANFKAKADALLTATYPADGPGVSVVVSDHGRIVYQGVRGMADVAAHKPLTPDSVFRMGSITKQFASAVVLQLVSEGKLSLDDPLTKFVPAYPGGAAITVRELLNHTSGIQSYTSLPGWMADPANTNRAYSTEQMIALFKDQPAVSKPGAEWAYNNSGYILVGAIIEAVEHKPWHQAVHDRITGPLGLTTIRYGVDEGKVAEMAKGYSEDGGKVVPARLLHMSVPGAAGALIGTPADLAKWGYALHDGKVVPAALYAQMIAPTTLPEGKSAPYGFGIEPGTLRGAASIGHSGGIFGYSTDSIYVPSDDLFVAVYTNSDAGPVDTGTTMRRLAAIAIDKPYPEFKQQPLDAKAVEPFVGTYKFKDMTRILAVEDGKLEYRRPESRTTQLIPVGGNRYQFGPGDLTWLELSKDQAGKPVMKVYPGGETEDDLGHWAGPVPAALAEVAVPAATLASYAGHYRSPQAPIEIGQGADGKLTVKLGNQPALPLRAIAVDLFEVKGPNAKVRFVSEGGKVIRLEILQGGRTLPATLD